jgi:hypothetical protein
MTHYGTNPFFFLGALVAWFVGGNLSSRACQNQDLQETQGEVVQDTETEGGDFSPEANDPEIIAAVISAFREVHEGFSSDEVLLQDELQASFIAACQKLFPTASPERLNWTLLNLRKQGKLSGIKTTRQNRISIEEVRHIGEIVARSIQDAHQISIDRALCNPETRRQFDELAQGFAAEIDLYAVRKAAFQLRKARQLRPELVTRLADWGREVNVYSLAELQTDLTVIPQEPGIYLFSDRQGYLYIGEADNLRRRLTKHLDESDRQALASYLKANDVEDIKVEVHTFEAGSRIGELTVRRAYESELIRSRHPRFNIRP